jgi:recombination protein RecA
MRFALRASIGEYMAKAIMPLASTIRMQVESVLARKIPSALTPLPKMTRPVFETGIEPLDDLLRGGLPIGALIELTGPECSGRTSIALSFLARITEANKVCAWIDVSNTFDPASAAAVGVNLKKLLWVRWVVQQMTTTRASRPFRLPEKYLFPSPIKKGLHGGGFGPHPRTEDRGFPDAVGELFAPCCAEPQYRARAQKESTEASSSTFTQTVRAPKRAKQYDAIEQGVMPVSM